MPFLCKQPSMLPHVLCASQCPPNNVYHEIRCIMMLFIPLQIMCHWLLDGLLDHFLACSSCSSLDDCVHDSTTWKVSYCSNYFAIDFYSTRLNVLLSYIKSCTFSFCCLHHRLFAFIDLSHTRTRPSFKSQLPSWLVCELDVLIMRLFNSISFSIKRSHTRIASFSFLR